MTWKRVATAVVLIPLVVGIVLWGSTPWVALALALIIALALLEYFALGDAIGHRAYRLWTLACAFLLIYAQWLAAVDPTFELAGGLSLHRAVARFGAGLLGVADAFFVFTLGIALLTLWTRRPLVESLPSAGISSSALLLVAFPLSFGVRLHAISEHGPVLLLFALVIVWVGDTVAYFVGRALGKHPLAPHLSPKKTWEGAVASFLGSLLAGALFMRWLNASLPHLLLMAALGNIAGQIGDLLESACKRSAGVKDSGGILPGHGGMLDRIDALILAIPVVWYYWKLIYSPGM